MKAKTPDPRMVPKNTSGHPWRRRNKDLKNYTMKSVLAMKEEKHPNIPLTINENLYGTEQ